MYSRIGAAFRFFLWCCSPLIGGVGVAAQALRSRYCSKRSLHVANKLKFILLQVGHTSSRSSLSSRSSFVPWTVAMHIGTPLVYADVFSTCVKSKALLEEEWCCRFYLTIKSYVLQMIIVLRTIFPASRTFRARNAIATMKGLQAVDNGAWGRLIGSYLISRSKLSVTMF